MDRPSALIAAPQLPEYRGIAPERTEAFVRLLGLNQRQLYVYVRTLVPSANDAEEVIQETNLVLWREFDRFERDTNFAASARRVALNQVLAWRKRRQRDRLVFSEAFLESVADEVSTSIDRLEERSTLLLACIKRMPSRQRTLLQLRYSDGLAIDQIAQSVERSVAAVYRALSRIRLALYECVTRSLVAENLS